MQFAQRSCWLFASLTVALIASANVMAAPIGYYNPGTGGIYLTNDTGASLGAISVISATNSVKTDPSLFTAIPGATFDPGDLPLGFTYLNFPPTNSAFGWYVGNVIKPGTSAGDLSGVYYTNAAWPTAPTFRIVEIPEPSSLALTACAATLLLRHRSRVGQASRFKAQSRHQPQSKTIIRVKGRS